MDCGPLEGIPYITRLSDYIRIGDWLREIGLRTPEIYEADESANIAIIEDFGSISMKQALEQGADAYELYKNAVDILSHIQSQTDCPLKLESFTDSPMRRARQRLVDWYVPALRKEKNPDGLRESYLATWDELEAGLDKPDKGFMHVDFHAENLMVLEGESGIRSLGIIDFQEALHGPLAYDLVNILEDMRVGVAEDIRAPLLQNKDENFLNWYRVLGTEIFHMRLMGQCVRWAIADNKPHYMKFLPRLENYIKRALQDPVLAPIKRWCDQEGLDFDSLKDFNPGEVKKFIAEDAI